MGKLLSGIKSMYVDISTCVREKGESKWFRIEREVKQGCRILEVESEWILSGLLYADDLVLCGESEEDLRMMVGRFAEVCKRRGLKVSAGKSKGMVLNEEERLECEVHGDGIHLEHVSEFKYLGYVLDEPGID